MRKGSNVHRGVAFKYITPDVKTCKLLHGDSVIINTVRRKKGELTKAKQKLWELCKQLTRAKYGNVCFTCGARNLEANNWHTGHFITKSTCSTELAYDLKNLRPQCYRCNISLSGNWTAFEEHLIRDEGAEYVQELKDRNRATKGGKYGIFWIQQKIEEYQQL